MPIPTFHMSVIGRGGRRSAVGLAAYGAGKTIRVRSMVAASAYRAGEVLRDTRQQEVYDYSDRDDVRFETILAPAHAPDWVMDRETLWNAVETRETRKDAQLGRNLIVALPRELTLEQSITLVRDYVQATFVDAGMVADLAVHDKPASDGLNNPHAHVLLTLREFEEDGTWAARKNREWNHPTMVGQWRNAWETMQNAYLEAAGSDARVSLRSYADQGINRTPQLHRGYGIDQMEQQGEVTRIGERNRDIAQENHMRALMDVMLDAAPADRMAAWAVESSDRAFEYLPLEPGALEYGVREPRFDGALMRAEELARLDELTLEDESERDAALERER